MDEVTPTSVEGAEIVERLLAKRERFVSRAAFKGVEEYHVNPDGPAAATHIATQETELTRLRQRVAERDALLVEANRVITREIEFSTLMDDDEALSVKAKIDALLTHQPKGDGAS